MVPQKKLAMMTDHEAWEAYRLYQRDVLLSCFEDADHILKRRPFPGGDDERRMVIGLLMEKRCQPWKYFRDEYRALQLRR